MGLRNERRINMEELKNYQEARRYKAVDALFKPIYIWGDPRLSIYGMFADSIEHVNYFEFQYKLHQGEDDIIESYRKEEDYCKKFLDGKSSFLEVVLKLYNFETVQTILLQLEYCLPKEVNNNGK